MAEEKMLTVTVTLDIPAAVLGALIVDQIKRGIGLVVGECSIQKGPNEAACPVCKALRGATVALEPPSASPRR